MTPTTTTSRRLCRRHLGVTLPAPRFSACGELRRAEPSQPRPPPTQPLTHPSSALYQGGMARRHPIPPTMSTSENGLSVAYAHPRKLGWSDEVAAFLLTRSPLGRIVRWVAGVPVSLHTKLLCAFLLITLVFIAMGAMSFQTITKMSGQSRLMHQARDRM